MNTDLDKAIEQHVHASLERAVSRTSIPATSDAAWGRAQRESRRRRRTRMTTSLLAACALLATMFGVYRATDIRKRNVAQTGAVERLRLVPTWMPDGVTLRLQDGFYSSGQEPQRNLVVWRQGDRRISVTSLVTTDPRYLNPQTLDLALVRLRKESAVGQYASWLSDGVGLDASIEPALPWAEFEAILRSITVDPATKFVSPGSMPANYKEVFRGDAKAVWPVDSWYMWPQQNYDQGVSVSAIKRSVINREVYGDAQDRTGFEVVDEVEIRGRKVKLCGSKAIEIGVNVSAPEKPTRFGLSWSERGWDVNVSAASKDAVLKVARGLRDATDQEWADFPSYNRGGINTQATPAERRKATSLAATIETGAGDIKVRAGDLVTAEGCVNLVFTGIGKDEKLCVKPSGKPILWSGVREVGGKKVVLAVVDLHVDSVMLTGKDEPVRPDIISSLSIDDAVPTGFVVDVSEDGATYQWIGIVALPFEGDKPGDLEAFSSTEFDRDAPSELVDTDADLGSDTASPEPESGSAEAGSADVDEPFVEYDMPLKSLGRFPVG
jgi:hypothetical protein